MGKFVVLSLVLHLIVLYTNICRKINTNFEQIENTKKYKIRVLKIRDVASEKFSLEKIDELKVRLFNNLDRNSVEELVLPEKKADIEKKSIEKDIVKKPLVLNSPPLTYPLPVYSSEKLNIKNDIRKNNDFTTININNKRQYNHFSSAIYNIKNDYPAKNNNSKKPDDSFEQYIQLYRDEIFTIVYRKFEKYTKNKKFINKDDSVILNVNISQDGKILEVTIKKASADEKLNKLCLDIIREVAKFPPFPKVLEVDVIKLTIPFKIKLP